MIKCNLKKNLKIGIWLFLLFGIILFSLNFASAYDWNFSTASDYIYNSTEIVVSGGNAYLNGTSNIPYAWWHLNEASGTAIGDSSGNNRNGTALSGPLWVSGKLNNALQFNGASNYVDFGNLTGNFERTQAFSVEFWFKTANIGQQIFMSKMQSAGNYAGWEIYFEGTGTNNIVFDLSNIATSNHIRVFCTPSAVADNNWHYLVVTYDGSSSATGVKFYFDNVLKTKSITYNSLTGSILTSTPFQLSGRGNGVSGINGLIDEVVIYDSVLTSDKITSRYNSGNGTESSIGNYQTGYYTIQPKTNFTFNSTLSEFTETATKTNSELQYSISTDGTFKYWNGTSWASSNGNWTQSNPASEINSHINTLGNSGNFTFKAILHSTNGGFTPYLDNIKVSTFSCTPIFACSLYNATCSGNPPTNYKCLQANDTTTCCSITGCSYAGNLSDFDIYYTTDLLSNSSLILTSYPYVDINTSFTIKSSIPTNNMSSLKLYILVNGTWNSYNLSYTGGYYQITLTFTQAGDYPFIVNGTNPCSTLTGQIQGTFLVRQSYNITFCGFHQDDYSSYENDYAYLLAEPTSSKKYYNNDLEQFITPLGFATTFKTPVFHTLYRNGCGTFKLYEADEYAVRLFDGVATFQTTFSPPNITKTYGTNIYFGAYSFNGTDDSYRILLSSKDIHQYTWLFNILFVVLLIAIVIISVFMFFVIIEKPYISILFGLGFMGMLVVARIVIWFYWG